MKPPFSRGNILNGRRGAQRQCEQGNWPEEGKQLLSAAGRPGQIHTVVPSIRGHNEAASAAGVSHSIVVDSKTGWNEWNETYWVHVAEYESLPSSLRDSRECNGTFFFLKPLPVFELWNEHSRGFNNPSVLLFLHCTRFFYSFIFIESFSDVKIYQFTLSFKEFSFVTVNIRLQMFFRWSQTSIAKSL